MPLVELALLGLAVTLALMTAVWLVSLPLRDASIVDSFWSLGFVVLAWLYHVLGPGASARGVLLAVLVTVWGFRLSAYVTWRNWGSGEDRRYQEFRKQWGGRYWIVSLFQVFLLQGVILWIVGAPLLVTAVFAGPDGWVLTDALGVLMWTTGLAFETIGDAQLARFKRDPSNKGKVLDTGLWRYTRHPNYFGDALVWWGHFVIAAGVPHGWITIFGPLLMTFLLMKVSGVSLLESTIVERRPRYREYIESTSAFFPWPPRKKGD